MHRRFLCSSSFLAFCTLSKYKSSHSHPICFEFLVSKSDMKLMNVYYNLDVSFMDISESLIIYISLFVIFSMHFWSEYITNHRWISGFDWVGVEFSDFMHESHLAPNNIYYLPLEANCRSFSFLSFFLDRICRSF